MPDPTPDRTFSLSADERHDCICDRFEAGWDAGRPSPIEDFLTEVPEEERAVLFEALLRVAHGRHPLGPDAVADFRARFPAYAGRIEAAIRDPAETPPLDRPNPALRPPRINGYEVSGSVGRGGMGIVFRGRQIGLDRPVAIKMMQAGDGLARFEVEARAVAGLSHLNVVTVYDFGWEAQDEGEDARPYLVMEFVDGGSLAERLSGAPADPEWAAGVVERLAQAMQYVHDQKIIHRDLKPANVLITADGTPKITDFGLAKRLTGGVPGLTATYTVLGTACYMSPEQARGDKGVGPPADIYALGGVLYECLTGRPPFNAGTYALTVAQVLSHDPVRPSDLVAGVPADLEAVCLKCLEKQPAGRYASAGDLADDLHRFLGGQLVLARPVDPVVRHARWAQRAGFELGDRLAAGSGTITYRARQAAIGRTVRLKLPVGPAAHAALRQEAEVLAGLDHPNVIRLHDYGEHAGQPYLVMEDIDGSHPLGGRSTDPVESAGAAHAPVPARRSGELGMMLALGLQVVHEHGFRLGGLWTGAVLVTREGVPKIANFAAARRTNDPNGSIPEWVPPAFLAPEVQAGAWDRVGPAADFFALGAVLYDLRHGEPPGGARWGEPEPALDAVVARCLDPNPDSRYPTAGAVALALQLALGRRPDDDPSDGSVVTLVPDEGASPDGSASHCLRIVGGPRLVGQTFAVPHSRLLIGRSKESDIRLFGKYISRRHCLVKWDPAVGCHEVVDLGAHNATIVNGEKVRDRRRLAAGDRLRIVDYELAFERLAGGPG